MKIAVITGAASGIGKGIAHRLASEGHLVAICDRDEASLAAVTQKFPSNVFAHPCDVADPEQVEAFLDRILRWAGAPTILVNNAGFARDVPFDEFAHRDWDDVIAVHLRGSYLFSRAMVPAMKVAGWGRIVSISSISAQGHAGRASYCAAKAGLEGMTRSLAMELGPFGVTVNAIAPGLIVTKMTEATAMRRGLSLAQHLEDAATRIPVRRAGTPEDVAAAASYFIGDQASFVTGQVLTVSGGVAV